MKRISLLLILSFTTRCLSLIGTEVTDLTKANFMATIWKGESDDMSGYTYSGPGVILSDKWVLTAYKILDGQKFAVKVGTLTTEGPLLRYKKVIRHTPGGLLQLAESITFSVKVWVAIPTEETPSPVDVYGFHNQKMTTAQANLVPTENCKEDENDELDPWIICYTVDDPNTLEVSDVGAVLIQSPNTLIGVLSFVQKKNGGFFAITGEIKKWIDKTAVDGVTPNPDDITTTEKQNSAISVNISNSMLISFFIVNQFLRFLRFVWSHEA